MSTSDLLPTQTRHCSARRIPMHVWYDGMLVYAWLDIPEQDAELPPPRIAPPTFMNSLRQKWQQLFCSREPMEQDR